MIVCFEDEKIPWWKRLYFRIRRFFFWKRKGKLAEFTAFQFPIIQQTFSSLSTDDIIKVQPMNEPSANVFYLDFIYKKPSWWKRMWKYLWINRWNT